jgi:hypothetical protein
VLARGPALSEQKALRGCLRISRAAFAAIIFDFKRYESGQHAAVCVLDPLLLSQCIADLHFVIDVPA